MLLSVVAVIVKSGENSFTLPEGHLDSNSSKTRMEGNLGKECECKVMYK